MYIGLLSKAELTNLRGGCVLSLLGTHAAMLVSSDIGCL